VTFEGRFDQFVEHAGRDAFFGLLEEHLSVIQEGLDVLSCLSSDKSDGAVGHRWKVLADVFNPAFCGDLTCEFVPFVDDEDTGFEFIVNVVS